VFVSQSGETKDVLNALEAAEARGMASYGLANVIGSTLTKSHFVLPALMLRIRNQRACHEDLYQSGRDVFISRLSHGGTRGARVGQDSRIDGSHDGHD